MPISTLSTDCAARDALLSVANSCKKNSIIGVVFFDSEGRMRVQAFGLDAVESISLFKTAANLLKEQS